MDNKLIRFYNQNRHMIWIIVLSVIAVISLIYIVNNYIEKSSSYTNNTAEVYNKKTDRNYSVITEEKVGTKISSIIDVFINNCNSGHVQEAYSILSDECKNILYPTEEDFTKNYYNKIFNSKKLYAKQAWITSGNLYTYRINFTEDILATQERRT